MQLSAGLPPPPPTLTLWTGSREVLASGVVICLAQEGLRIALGTGVSHLYLNIKFATEGDGKTPRLKAAVMEEELQVTAFNFNSSIGTGTTNAIEIGTYHARKLFLHVWAYAHDSVKIVTYTLLLDKSR